MAVDVADRGEGAEGQTIGTETDDRMMLVCAVECSGAKGVGWKTEEVVDVGEVGEAGEEVDRRVFAEVMRVT